MLRRSKIRGGEITIMYLETPPKLITTKVFTAMPDHFRRKGVTTEWADANEPEQPTDCFIEGPSFDAEGNLYIVDIPFVRIFRISPDGNWSLAAEYEGWPKGLKIAADGRIIVADFRRGIMELDANAGRMKPVLTSRNSESFRGIPKTPNTEEIGNDSRLSAAHKALREIVNFGD